MQVSPSIAHGGVTVSMSCGDFEVAFYGEFVPFPGQSHLFHGLHIDSKTQLGARLIYGPLSLSRGSLAKRRKKSLNKG